MHNYIQREMEAKVETISRLVQWKIETFGPCTFKRSDPFKMGPWTWNLSVEKNRHMYIRLFPEPTRIAKEQPPIARFILRVTATGGLNRRPYVSPIHERLLRTSEDFVWPVDSAFHGRFIIDVEFLDLKVCPTNGGEATSIWPCGGQLQSLATESALRCLSRMLNESIHTDVTIKTNEGTLWAHKAILSASSPVFHTMFVDNLGEESSTIDIEDMSLDSCMALLSYLYGNINQEEFWKHRLSLLGAANKYDIIDLKNSCEESLMEDINSGNVLERLQEACLYKLDKLKKGCMTYLFAFGKIYDVKDEIHDFFKHAEREVVVDMFQEVLTAWKLA